MMRITARGSGWTAARRGKTGAPMKKAVRMKRTALMVAPRGETGRMGTFFHDSAYHPPHLDVEQYLESLSRLL
jgi:hypothetical protein